MLSIIKNIHFLSHRFSASGSQAQLICVLSSGSQKTVIRGWMTQSSSLDLGFVLQAYWGCWQTSAFCGWVCSCCRFFCSPRSQLVSWLSSKGGTSMSWRMFIVPCQVTSQDLWQHNKWLVPSQEGTASLRKTLLIASLIPSLSLLFIVLTHNQGKIHKHWEMENI